VYEEFKAVGLLNTGLTICDDSIAIHNMKTHKYNEMFEINAGLSGNEGTVHIRKKSGNFLTNTDMAVFKTTEKERFYSALSFANQKIASYGANEKGYKYVLYCNTGTKAEIYDDYMKVYHYSDFENQLLPSLELYCGAAGKTVSIIDIKSASLQGNTLELGNTSLQLSSYGMETARAAFEYIESVRSQIQSEHHETWELITGSAKSFPIMGKEINVPENMDTHTKYKEKFKEFANIYTDKFESDYDSKVHDLTSYISFLPQIYIKYLKILIKKSMNVLITEGVWTASEDAMLEQNLQFHHDGLAIYSALQQAIEKTSAKNQAEFSALMSALPNMVVTPRMGGGFVDSVAGIATATLYNYMKSDVEGISVAAIDNLAAAQQQELYARVKKADLIMCVFSDYWQVHVTLIKTLRQNDKDIWWPKGGQEADNMFQNLSNPNFPQDKILDALLFLFSLNPYNSDYHKFLASRFGNTDEVAAIRRYFLQFDDFNNPRK